MARRTKLDDVPKPGRLKVAPPPPAGFPPPARAPGQGVAATGRASKKFPDGKPLAWGNPSSVPAYGHSQSEHGAQRDPQELKDRARPKADGGTGQPQGQWAHNDLIVEAEQRAPLGEGEHVVDMGRPIGTVHHPDGSETQTSIAVVVRNEDGTVKTSYPAPPRN